MVTMLDELFIVTYKTDLSLLLKHFNCDVGIEGVSLRCISSFKKEGEGEEMLFDSNTECVCMKTKYACIQYNIQ